MSTLKSFLSQQEVMYLGEPKSVVLTIADFDPPTTGHGRLIESVVMLAMSRGADSMIVPSRSDNAVLPFDVKVAFMKQLFPNENIVEDAPTIAWDIPRWLGEAGYTDVTIVTASDETWLEPLVEYAKPQFNSFTTVDAGFDSPDHSQYLGMSSPKAIAAARNNDIGAFRVATGWSGERAARLMEATKLCLEN